MGKLSETLLSLLGEKQQEKVKIIQNDAHSNETTTSRDKKIDDSFIFLEASDGKKTEGQRKGKTLADMSVSELVSQQDGTNTDKSKREVLLTKEPSLREDALNKEGINMKETCSVIDYAKKASENEKLQPEELLNTTESKDCLECKIVSTVTCFGVGSYMLYKGWKVPPHYTNKAFAFRGFALGLASMFFLLGTGALFDVKVIDEDFGKHKSISEFVQADVEKMKTLGNRIQNMDIKLKTEDQSKP